MGHTFSNILIHAVFSTKNREPLIREAFRERLYQYMSGIARDEFGRVLRIGGMADHIHGLLVVNPSISVSDAIGKWKGLSSGWVNRELPDFAPFYWQPGLSHKSTGWRPRQPADAAARLRIPRGWFICSC